MRSLCAALVLSIAGWLTGCAHSPGTPESDHYVLVRADQTQLLWASNDAENVILTFSVKPPDSLEFFDHHGKPLKTVRKGRLVCVGGLHRGILLRNAQAVSYVSVKPGARLRDGPQMPVTDELLALRRQVTVYAPAEQAMKRAIAALQLRSGTKPAEPITSQETSADKPALQDPLSIALAQWRQTPPIDIPGSRLHDDSSHGYIVFLPGALMPVKASEVIDQLVSLFNSDTGVLLISGITPPDAPEAVVHLARQRARLIHEILVQEGVDPDRLTVSAIYQSGTHTRLNPERPGQTVGLTWLNDS